MLIVGNQLNGLIPTISTLLSELKAELIPSKGFLTTVLIPSIILFTGPLIPSRIPSLIPSNILPPELNTFLTFVQASVKVSLNQPLTLPKPDLMLDQTLAKPVFALANAPVALLYALLKVVLNQFPV